MEPDVLDWIRCRGLDGNWFSLCQKDTNLCSWRMSRQPSSDIRAFRKVTFSRSSRRLPSACSASPPRLLDRPQVSLRPLADGLEQGLQRRPQGGQRVLDLRRNYWVDLPLDEAVALQVPQGLDEHLLRDPLQLSLELAVTLLPFLVAPLSSAAPTSLAPHPGSSTQCEWTLSGVFTVLLGHLRVSMTLQSKYLCVRTPNTTIPCGQRHFSREVDHEHR